MKLANVKEFCNVFYKRFSALNIEPYQLKFYESPDSVSICLMKRNEEGDIEAALTVTENTVRLLKIDSFEKIDTFFTFATPLELYTNLLTLLLMCCHASGVIISPVEALAVTLGRRIKTWRELVFHICSLLPEEKGCIVVKESRRNALRFLKTDFRIRDNVLVTDGMHRSETPFKDTLELIRAVLDSLSAVLNIHGYLIDPFFKRCPGPLLRGFFPAPAGLLNGPRCPQPCPPWT